MSFFLFPTQFNTSQSEDTLVIFWTYEYGEKIDDKVLHELRPQIHHYLNKHILFNRILFLTHEKNESQFEGISYFFQHIDLTYSLSLSDVSNGLLFASFDNKGVITFAHNKWFSDKDVSRIILDGLAEIFNKRGGLIGPSDHVHYVLPSGNHSAIFVRTGNIFKTGSEISFIGFCLLKYLRTETTHIYCDTSSIIVAAQAAVSLKKLLEPTFVLPDIHSFGSYKGIEDFRFIDPGNALFLISASYSGGLTDLLYKKIHKHTTDDFIVTLFRFPFVSESPESNHTHFVRGKVICDLQEVELPINPEKLRIFQSECAMCKKHSIAVHITGDEFMPERKPPKRILLTEKHKPTWFNSFMRHFIGRNYIACHRKKKTNEQNRELYIDIDRLHHERIEASNKEYNELFTKYLNRKLPAALLLIVFLDDSASETIAGQIRDFYDASTRTNGQVQLLRYTEQTDFVAQMSEVVAQREGSILVAASSIAQSRSILKISRDLRSMSQAGCQLCYFVSVVRTYTEAEFRHIKTNLLFSKKYGNETHVFDSLLNIFIPDERYRDDSPWQQELEVIQSFFNRSKEELEDFDKEALKSFRKRLRLLENAAKDGLTNDLFWPTLRQEPLQLNYGFVYFDFELPPIKMISQADVYFTIASILHYLRTEHKEGNQLLLAQSEYQRKILDPENFSRFNDGIIQACLLRAAQDIELDYSHDEAASITMAILIKDFADRKDPAILEFLLALAIGKVKLAKEDARNLHEYIYNQSEQGIVKILLAIFHEHIEEHEDVASPLAF